MQTPLRATLALLLAAAPVRAADPVPLTVSSASVKSLLREAPRVGLMPAGTQGRAAVGVGVGLKEGPVLQGLVWAGSGAIVGSFAGPVGAAVGAVAGAAVGLVVSFFVVPRVQPGMGKGPPQG